MLRSASSRAAATGSRRSSRRSPRAARASRELVEALDRHRDWLAASGGLDDPPQSGAHADEIEALAVTALRRRMGDLRGGSLLDELAERVLAGDLRPVRRGRPLGRGGRGLMSRAPLGLPFDPIERAGEIWETKFGPAAAMRVATSVMRAQTLACALRRDPQTSRPHVRPLRGLVLLDFSRVGELPLSMIGQRLMVHPTSVTNIVDRLVAQGFVERRPNPSDGRGVLARLTAAGRRTVITRDRRPDG